MHDPSHLALSVPRPFPKLRRSKLRSRRLYWPAMVDVWHDEPDGRDAGSRGGCGYAPSQRTWSKLPRLAVWLWRHRAHLRVNVLPVRNLRCWLHLRCAHCGKPHRRHFPVNVSHGWGDGPAYHAPCSAVVQHRRALLEARRALVAAEVDEGRLVAAGWPSTDAWRVCKFARDAVEPTL